MGRSGVTANDCCGTLGHKANGKNKRQVLEFVPTKPAYAREILIEREGGQHMNDDDLVQCPAPCDAEECDHREPHKKRGECFPACSNSPRPDLPKCEAVG